MTTRGGGCRTETHISRGELADQLGSTILFIVVALPTMFFWLLYVAAAGIDQWLHKEDWFIRAAGIELVALPLAALAAAVLRWGMEVIDEPHEGRYSLWLPLLGTAAPCVVMWSSWVGVLALPLVALGALATGFLREAILEARASGPDAIDEPRENNTPWVPWLGAALAFAVVVYLVWSWAPPQTLVGPSQFGVARWVGTALVAGVGYFGMIFFPRLTASLAGAVVGPALFAVVGYILFPSFMQGPEGRTADILALASVVGATVVATAMPLAIASSERFRRSLLSYVVWTGVLTFCLAVFGTINRTYFFS